MTKYSIIIATMERPGRLRDTLESVALQTWLPDSVVVVDASDGNASEEVCAQFEGRLRIDYQRARERSAASQRNQGAEHVEAPLIAFIDDDVVLEPDVFAMLADVFRRRPDAGSVAARMRGFGHARPKGALRLYYRLQAGYDHPTWGGRMFGAAINCLPCYEEDEATEDHLIAGEWSPATVLMVSTQAFREVDGYPDLVGYSFMEDAWLTAEIAKRYRVWFHTSALYDHYPSVSSAKRNVFELGRMRVANRRSIARQVLGQGWLRAEARLLLHKLFVAVVLLRDRPSGWIRELFGTVFG